MDETENQSPQRLSELTRLRTPENSLSALPLPHTCPAETATMRARILLCSYRKGEAEEPEIYSAAVAAILSSYPVHVAYRVTDPRTGLPGKSQWLPTVAEVKAACEAEMAPARAQAQRESRRRENRVVFGEPIPEHDRAAAMARIMARHEDVVRAPRERRDAQKFHPLLPGDKRFDCAGVRLSPALRAQLARPKEAAE